jgi:hypothetical protein
MLSIAPSRTRIVVVFSTPQIHRKGAIMKLLAILFLAITLPSSFGQTDCPVPTDKHAPDVPLCLVAQQITRTLDTYNADASSKSLPPLSKVVFDFKTTIATSGGFSFKIFIFSIGASHEKDTTNDVSFTYTVPPPSRSLTPPHDFSTDLLNTLRAAAAQVKQTPTVGRGKFSALTVTLAYGVTWDLNGGAAAPISLVTLGGNLDRKRADTQTLTLVFSEPEKPSPH